MNRRSAARLRPLPCCLLPCCLLPCCLLLCWLALVGGCGESEGSPNTAAADVAVTADSSATADTAGPALDGGPSQDTGAPQSLPTIELGGSDNAGKTFVDWSNDKVVPPLVHGIQGGEHIYVSVRMRNMDPKSMNLELHQHIATTGEEVFPSPIKWFGQTLKKETVDGVWTGWYFRNGYTGFVNCPCLVTGKQLRLELIATSKDGKVTAKSMRLVTPGGASAMPLWDGDCNDDEYDECKMP